MEQFKNEQTEPQAQETIIEQSALEGEVSLGKFKDVSALLSAYNSLQSEFTKRCQKVKELEGKLALVDKENFPDEKKQVLQTQIQEDTNLLDKDKILKEYLLEVIGKKPKAIVMDGAGVGVKTPVSRPKTIEEAGNLAKKLLNN